MNTLKFAVIETGGKQYKVSEGESIKIEKLSEKYKAGDEIIFDKVLLVDDGKETKIGDPYLEGQKIKTEFVEEGREKKIRIMQFKSKSNYLKRMGHRQTYHKVKIINL